MLNERNMILKREDKMLLDCLRGDSDFSKYPEATADDWDMLFKHSVRHSVAQMVYRQFKKTEPGAPVPIRVLDRLHVIYLKTADRNIRFYHELSKVLKILNDRKIPTIVLKGAHLGEIIYGSLAIRAMADVDLLFKREDLSRAQENLKEAGYLSERSPLILDIHIDFDRDITIDMKKVWENARTVEIAGQKTLVLSPEDLLVHLCMHLAYRHMFKDTGLRMICDIAETIRYYGDQINWECVLERSAEWNVNRSVYASLFIVSELMGTDIPNGILDSLKTGLPDEKVKTWVLEQIFREEDDVFLSRYFWRIICEGGFREKLAGFRELVFPSPEYISHQYDVNYGSLQNYIYYLTRFGKFFAKYAQTTWKILMRDEKMLSKAQKEKRNVMMRKWMLGEK